MSDPITTPDSTRSLRSVRTVGLFSILAGVVLIVAGLFTWYVISDQLDEQNITVSDDAAMFGGDQVKGPFTAFAQAQVIEKHALKATGGKTYAELEQDDPLRETAMNASFLRASLFTSVVAYGVAAFAMGMGLLWLLLGWSLRKLAP